MVKGFLTQRIKTLCLLLVVVLSVGGQDMANYKKWQRLSSKQLKQMGNDFLLKEHKTDSAMICFSIVANRFYGGKQSLEDQKLSIDAMNNMGYAYLFHYYDYEKTYNSLQKAIEEAEHIGYSDIVASASLNMANLMLTENVLRANDSIQQQTLELYKQSFYASVDAQNWNTLLLSLGNMTEMEFNNIHQQGIKKEIEIFKSLSIPDNQPLLRFTKTLVKAVEDYWRKDYDGAIGHFHEAIGYIDDKGTPERFEMLILANIAQVQKAMGKNEDAFKTLSQLQQMAEQHQTLDIMVNAYQDMYRLLDSQNDSRAHDYQFLYLQAKDSLINHSKLENVNQMRFINQLGKMEDEVKQMAQKRKIQNIVVGSVILFALTVVVFLLFIIRKNRRLRENNEMLYQKVTETLENEERERQLRKQTEQLLLSATKPAEEKYKSSLLDTNDKEYIYNEILTTMEGSDEIYSFDFSVERLAELVGYKTRDVSQVVNEMYGNNFSQFLSDYRIKEACRRLADIEHYGHLSIEGIATGLGFKSRTNFVNVFKRYTGLTPSEFKKVSIAKKTT